MANRQFFDLRPGDVLTIGASRVTVEAKTGQRTRLKIESDQPTAKERPNDAPRPAPKATASTAAMPFLPRPKPA